MGPTIVGAHGRQGQALVHSEPTSTSDDILGFPPDAFQNGDYAFFDAENNAGLIVGNYAAIMLVWPNSWGLCRNYALGWVGGVLYKYTYSTRKSTDSTRFGECQMGPLRSDIQIYILNTRI